MTEPTRTKAWNVSATSHPQVQALVAAFERTYRDRMQDLPIVRKDFEVQAVDFTAWEGRLLGVLITPWFINLILLPGPQEDWSKQRAGSKTTWRLPAGDVEFTAAVEERSGPYQSCALFSSLAEFPDQASARRVAQAVIPRLLNGAGQAASSRPGDVSGRIAARDRVSRRDVLRGRLRQR